MIFSLFFCSYPSYLLPLSLRMKVFGNRRGSITILNITLFCKREEWVWQTSGATRCDGSPGTTPASRILQNWRWMTCIWERVSDGKSYNIQCLIPHNGYSSVIHEIAPIFLKSVYLNYALSAEYSYSAQWQRWRWIKYSRERANRKELNIVLLNPNKRSWSVTQETDPTFLISLFIDTLPAAQSWRPVDGWRSTMNFGTDTNGRDPF